MLKEPKRIIAEEPTAQEYSRKPIKNSKRVQALSYLRSTPLYP